MPPSPRTIPQRVLPFLIGGLVALFLVTAWTMFQAYTPAASRRCAALYSVARTAADTAAADATVPRGETARTLEPRSCGAIRLAARWR
jgi:predicted negative regulator of RcsB-dependent stress response